MPTSIRVLDVWLLLLLVPLSICAGDDSKWDYTQEGSYGVSEEHAGKTGNFRTYECTTDDSTEKVVL